MGERIRSKYITLAVIFFLIIFAGCSIKETVRKGSEEEVLRTRVMTYCTYRTEGDFVKSYEFEDPFSRKKMNLSNYIKRMSGGGVQWIKAEISEMELKEDTAKVSLNVKVKGGIGGNMLLGKKTFEHDSRIEEQWIRVDGLWYHVLRKMNLGGGEN